METENIQESRDEIWEEVAEEIGPIINFYKRILRSYLAEGKKEGHGTKFSYAFLQFMEAREDVLREYFQEQEG